MQERLNRYLARCGVASRRAAEEFILAGRVAVNGQPVREMGAKIDPDIDRVSVDGEAVAPARAMRVFMLNKPRGVVTTVDDPHAPQTLAPWLERCAERLYPVGRLDRDSEGLLLLTNDGELTLRLTHPRYHLEKEYRVSAAGDLTAERARRLREGVDLDDGPTLPARVEDIQVSGGRSRFSLVLREGRNRQIRRMCEAVGLRVIRLVRRRVGPLTMRDLKAGDMRELEEAEARALRAAVEMTAPETARRPEAKPTKPPARRDEKKISGNQKRVAARKRFSRPPEKG